MRAIRIYEPGGTDVLCYEEAPKPEPGAGEARIKIEAAGVKVLVHAAAGGLGLLVVQVAKQLGARVFGTVSTDEKARLAKQAGADETILYTQVDFEPVVKQLTGGKGVNVVYDSVGKTTFD